MNRLFFLPSFLTAFILFSINLQAQNPVDDSLMAHFTFDGELSDLTGNFSDAVNHGCEFLSGSSGEEDDLAIYFDGGYDYFELEHKDFFNEPNFSFSLWIYKEDASIEQNPAYSYALEGIFHKGSDTFAGNRATGLIISKTGSPFNVLYSSSASNEIYHARADNVIKMGTWYHIVGVTNPDEIQLYFNGQLVHTYPTNGFSPNNEPLLFGAIPNGFGMFEERFFHGRIDDLRIYSKELSETEVVNLYERSPEITSSQSLSETSFNLPETSFKIYPNPSNGSFTLESTMNDNEILKVKVFDPSGKMIHSLKSQKSKQQIDLNFLGQGIYYLTVETKDGVWTEQILVSNRLN